MRKGVLRLLIAILIGSMVSCGSPNNKSNNGSVSSVITSVESSVEKIEVDYQYNINGNLINLANEQFELMTSLRQLIDGTLSENDLRISRANLWTYSAYYTMVNQLKLVQNNTTNEQRLIEATNELEWYRSKNRADDYLVYASKNGTEKPAFFDDNIWVVIGFINAYKTTNQQEYLDKATSVMDWIYTGWDDEKGGLYWREYDKNLDPERKERNTCINGPAAWASLLLYEITENKLYRDWGIRIYTWTKKWLYSTSDKVYYDNINGANVINRWTFTYNTGTMLSAASYLYKLTHSDVYKNDVDDLITGSYNKFYLGYRFDTLPDAEFHEDNPWFRVYLLQGYLDAMMNVNINYGVRLESVKKALLYGYEKQINPKGFLNEDWSGRKVNELGENRNKSLNVIGNIECISILARYEAYLSEVTK